MKKSDEDQYMPEEAEQRLHKVLEGAFSGPPTPLKDIPKKGRASRKRQPYAPKRHRDGG